MSQMNTPQVSSDFDIPSTPPAWPKVVGIISIVWASLGIVCNICGAAGQAMQGAIIGMVPPEQQEQMRQQMAAQSTPLTTALYIFGALVAVLLLAAGITTVQRKPLGRVLHLAYGAIGVLMTIVGTAITISVLNAQVAQLQADPSTPPQQLQGMQFGMYFGVVFGACFGLAYPLFCLVWFGMLGKRPEAGAATEEPIV